ncbi:MAG: hypothetical protein JL50_02765 [Peptococcaceae bacterium BICA1-7]|nr:MAG: hypothetical protein JL50_02765 [Peptococcaceae bacterium BICA1-7]HBV97814.1 hypothetical protein [Desulfotomaculum sp.]
MYNKLHELVKDNLNRRIAEPGDTILLKEIIGALKGLSIEIKINSSSIGTYSEERIVSTIKDSKYIGRQVSITTDIRTLRFPASGIIVTSYDENIIITIPNNEEFGSNLILKICHEKNSTI